MIGDVIFYFLGELASDMVWYRLYIFGVADHAWCDEELDVSWGDWSFWREDGQAVGCADEDYFLGETCEQIDLLFLVSYL